MALPLLVSVTAFAESIGEDWIDDEDGRAVYALRGASARVRSYTGRTWVDTEGAALPTPEDVSTVVIAAAERKWRNPAGTIQDTTGPFSVRRSERAGDGIYLTDEDRAMLDPYRLRRRGLWSMRVDATDPYMTDLANETNYVGTRYADTDTAGEPIPWTSTAELP